MPKKKRVRKCKCLHCRMLFAPDPRQKDRQDFCSISECQRASKAHSQRKWLSKPKNRKYFCGKEHVERVRQWRKENPSYAKDAYNRKKALQDTCLSQPSLVVGLIASLSGLTLQDEIAVYIRKIHSRGEAVLAMKTTKIGDKYENQEAVVTPRAGALCAGAL